MHCQYCKAYITESSRKTHLMALHPAKYRAEQELEQLQIIADDPETDNSTLIAAAASVMVGGALDEISNAFNSGPDTSSDFGSGFDGGDGGGGGAGGDF